MIGTTPKLDAEFNISEEGWRNKGLSSNPDGSQSYIEVYGGPNAWK